MGEMGPGDNKFSRKVRVHKKHVANKKHVKNTYNNLKKEERDRASVQVMIKVTTDFV
jgi:hypothetical protein